MKTYRWIRNLSQFFSLLSAVMAATFLCSCASTSVEKTWKSPQFQPPIGNVAVLVIEERGLLREGFENRLVRELKQAGVTATTTFDLLALSDIQQGKAAAAGRLRASGAESLLIFRLMAIGSSYRETQPGGERYAGVVTGFENYGWYDYYSVAFANMSPTYGSLKARVYLEAVVFDLATEQRLWSVMTETVIKENTDRVAEMDPIAQKIVAAMQKDGVLP